MATKFRVLGAGVWGLAFSDYLLNLGHTVEIFRRDVSIENESIQQLGLKNISSNHIKSLETLNDQKLDEEIKFLKGPERQRIIKAIAEAREHGDLSENAEYHAAKEQQSHNEGRILELEDMLNRAEIIDISSLSGDNVKFGATVSLVDEDTDEEMTYQIVGDYEANVEEGRISISSPIARGLIGKEVGDSVEVRTPGGSKFYEILDVKFI